MHMFIRARHHDEDGCIDRDSMKVKIEMEPLCKIRPDKYSASIQRYFNYYGLSPDKDAVGPYDHFFGTFESDGKIIAGHIFAPKKYRATVFVLHRYLSHCGQLKHLIKCLLQQDFIFAFTICQVMVYLLTRILSSKTSYCIK